MESRRVFHILEFLDSIINEQARAQIYGANLVLELVEEVKRCIAQHIDLLPYHLNLIDELHINENGHSRILCKLLQYKSQSGEYPILQSLLEYIAEQNSQYKAIAISSPIITQERCRIDLWVRDKEGGYAIIFENKIYNATDQDAQLSRYIECTKATGFTDEQIFVVYLSNQGAEPAAQSWGNYYALFESRYINLSFRYDILPWLRERIVPILPEKEYLLRCAVEQYIDYLEGIFNLRAINNELNMKIEESIREKLGLTGVAYDDYRTIRQYQEDINNILNHLEALKKSIELPIFEQWQKDLIARFPELKDNVTLGYRKKRIIYVGVDLEINGHPIRVVIDRDTNIYYGIFCTAGKDPNATTLIEKAIPAYNDWETNPSWYCWRYTELESAFDNLVELIEAILSKTTN